MALDAVPPVHAAFTDVPPLARVPREVQLQSKLDCFFPADPLHSVVHIPLARDSSAHSRRCPQEKGVREIRRLPKFFGWSSNRFSKALVVAPVTALSGR